MTDPHSDLGRLLADAFDAHARGAVGDHTAPPPPRFADPDAGYADVTHRNQPGRRNRARIWAPLAAAAAVVAIVAGAFVVTDRPGDNPAPVAAPPASSATSAPTTAAGSSSALPAGAKAVRVRSLNSDGATYGVGMPVIAYFSKKITDARALQGATRTTVDGTPVDTAWYFQRSSAGQGPVEGHLRPKTYWPGNAKVRVVINARGLSAGTGMAFGNDLTLDFRTGPRQIATVDNSTHTLTLNVDGKQVAHYPVSLGAAGTPTQRGIKVIMEKGRSISMRGPGYNESGVKDTQRLTYGGEYLHAAPWNTSNISKGVNSSNGCTNLTPSDAHALYSELRVGDVVTFPNANGPKMQLGQGYGDWNVPWGEWQTGGLAPTR